MTEFINQWSAFGALVAGALAAYYGAQNAMKVSIARLEEKITAMERRQESDHDKLDELEHILRKN